MNYICQMNGFWRWRRDHELPASPQLLWYTLTAEQNYRRWPLEFEMSATVLCRLMGGISINTFRRSRDNLISEGLMEVKMATHGSEVSRYHMTQLYAESRRSSRKSCPDRSTDGSADGSTDGSTNGSESAPAAEKQASQAAPKPNTLNPKDKTPLEENSESERRQTHDGRSVGNGLAEPAEQNAAKRPRSAECGSSRRAIDWEREQECGL